MKWCIISIMIIKRLTIFIFLLLFATNQCFATTAGLDTKKKLALYMEDLRTGSLESFWMGNHSFLAEEKAIKQNFPNIMWTERISPIKAKWRKTLLDSIGTVKKGQLWDYLYEPGSDVKATVLEIREGEHKAFVQIEYPNYETAPLSNAQDHPRIKKVILNLGIKEGSFDFINGVNTVNGTIVLYPLDIPLLTKHNAREILEKKISSKPPILNVVTKRMIFDLRRGKDWDEMVQFMKDHGFSYEIAESNFGKEMSSIHIGCPKDWEVYLRMTHDLFSTIGNMQEQNFALALKSKVEILHMMDKDKKEIYVQYKYFWADYTPVHDFWLKLKESGYVKKCIWSTKNMAHMLTNTGSDTIYKASFVWSYKKGWRLKQLTLGK